MTSSGLEIKKAVQKNCDFVISMLGTIRALIHFMMSTPREAEGLIM
jgi:hypothetical protein